MHPFIQRLCHFPRLQAIEASSGRYFGFHQEDAYEFFMDCMHQVTSRCIGCSVDVWEWTCSPLCAGAEPWWFFCILPSPHDCCQLSEELAEAARVLLAGGSIDSSTLTAFLTPESARLCVLPPSQCFGLEVSVCVRVSVCMPEPSPSPDTFTFTCWQVSSLSCTPPSSSFLLLPTVLSPRPVRYFPSSPVSTVRRSGPCPSYL